MRNRASVSRRRVSRGCQPLVRHYAIELCEPRLLLSIDAVPHAIQWYGANTEAYQGQWILSLAGWQGGLLDQQAQLDAEIHTLGLAGQIEIDTHLGRSGLFRIESQATDYLDVLRSVAKLDGFAYLEPDFVLDIQALPNDPEFSDLWGLNNTGQSGGVPGADISAVEAWDITTGSSNVVVGVVDTGIAYTHVDLADNIWHNPNEIAGDNIDNDGNGYIDDTIGWDFFSNDADPMDYRSHGTHVAGTIGGVGNNGIGVTGINWDVSLMALKIAGDDPGGNTVSSSAATAALNYAADLRMNHGINIRVTNHSWGGGGFSTSLRNAIELNATADILLVAAAGNDSRDNDSIPQYPAGYELPNIISVASTTRTDGLSSFSNYGITTVDLGAPGSSVFSTVLNNGYGNKSGTSMATPHVVGVAALAAAFRPSASYQEIKDAILNGVDLIPALDGMTVTGGRLNALRTLQLLGLNATPLVPTEGAILSTPPLDFTMQFSSNIDLDTLDFDDFEVNGIPADSVAVNTLSQVTFSFNTSPVTLEGEQTMTMAAGAVLRLSDGYALNAMDAKFRYDVTTLAVTSIVPAQGATAVYPVMQIEVAFNEPIDAGSVGLSDLTLSEGKVTLAQPLGPNSARYTVSGIVTEGNVNVSLSSSSVTDVHGNPMAPFASSFVLDVDERPLANFVRVEPYGSLISESLDNFGRIGAPGDVDVLAIDLRGGETLTAVVRPTSPSAVITAEFEGLTSPVVGSPGAAVVVPLVAVSDNQVVRLRIIGDLATDYHYDVYRNAAIEPPGAGQSLGLSIDDSRLDIAGTRFALIATADPAGTSTDEMTLDLNDAGGQYLDILLTGLDGTNLAGQTLQLVNPGNQVVATGTALAGGDDHDAQVGILGYEVTAPGVYKLRVTSSIEGRYSLVASLGTLFSTEPNNGVNDPLRSLNNLGTAVGHLGTRLEDGVYTLVVNTGASALEASGSLSAPPEPDVYSMTPQAPGSLSAAASGTIVVRIQDGTIEILNTSSLDFAANPGPFLPGNAPADLAGVVDLGGLVAQAAIRNLDASAGTQQVVLGPNNEFDLGGMRVFLNGGQFDYAVVPFVEDSYDLDGLAFFNELGLVGSLTVTPGQLQLNAPILATVDEEVELAPGLVIALEMILDGQVVAALPFGDAEDRHSITLEAGQVITVSTRTPLAGGVLQDLDPLVKLYSSTGVLLASDANSLDGTNGQFSYLVTVGGTYQVGVAAESGFGEYELVVDVANAVTLVPDDENPALNNLVFAGTSGADHVLFTEVTLGMVEVTFVLYNGVSNLGTIRVLDVTGRVIGHGDSGNDTLDASGLATLSADLSGGAGNDTVLGGAADDVLMGDADGGEGADHIEGGAGNDFIDTGGGNDYAEGGDDNDVLLGGDGGEGASDTLLGGNGRDILIGDGGPTDAFKLGGSDMLNGGAGEDLIISGHYLPALPGDLAALQQSWIAADPFASRVAAIENNFLQLGVTLFNDNSNAAPGTNLVDTVLGGDDLDWLLYDFVNDSPVDTEVAEQADAVDLSAAPRPVNWP